jgi:hypothetical protein
VAATRLRRRGRRAPRRRAGIGVLPWLAAGLGGLAARGAAAQSYVDSRLLLYKESDGRTQVIDPLFFLHQDLGQSRGELDLIAGFDVISGASPTGAYPSLDVTTSASGRTSANGEFPSADYTDRRGSLSAAYRRRFGSHLPQVDLSYSKENDYTAKGVGISDAWTMLEGRGTLHLGLSASRDVVLPAGTSVERPKDSSGFALGWTWVLGERDLLDVSGSLTRLSGYLDDPYKIVPIGSPDAGTTAPDHRPDSRQRFALVAKYGHYYSWEGAIKTSYRFYSDDWGVKAHTIEIDYDQHLGSDWIVSPQVRLYVQSGASFYGSLFVQPETYMSADYRLSAFNSVVGGLKVTKTIFHGFDIYAGVTYQVQQGSDRITLTNGTRRKEDDNEGGGGTASVSAADLNVATLMIGFTRHF